MHGILLLDKPLGMSSNIALQKVRRLLGKPKAGHLGTLDPLASGLLPLAINDATKFAHYGLLHDKTYEVTFTLGEATRTGDREGDIIATGPVFEGDLTPIVESFGSGYEQMVPTFSAIKIQGKPSYQYAIEGKSIEMPARFVQLHQLDILFHAGAKVGLRAHVGKGTYIRQLVQDIAAKVGTVAVVDTLRRTQVGPYGIAQSITLEGLERLSPEQRWEGLWPLGGDLPFAPLVLGIEQLVTLRYGQSLPYSGVDGVYKLFHEGAFVGLGEVGANLLKVKKLTHFDPTNISQVI